MRLLPPHWCRSYDASLKRRREAARQKRNMRSFYGQFVRPGDLCFDVGANMGNRTATLLDVGARVICVEPQHACVRKLRKLYGKNPNVVIVEAALGEKEGGGALAICEEEPAISTMSDKWRQEGRFAGSHTWVKTVPVVVTTLNQLITLYGRPVFCKIDVEGFEVSVLKGLSRPIPLISFEFTRELFTDAKACMDRLLSLGPAVFNASFGESMTFVQEEWMSPEALTRRIDAEDDLLLWGDIYAKKM